MKSKKPQAIYTMRQLSKIVGTYPAKVQLVALRLGLTITPAGNAHTIGEADKEILVKHFASQPNHAQAS